MGPEPLARTIRPSGGWHRLSMSHRLSFYHADDGSSSTQQAIVPIDRPQQYSHALPVELRGLATASKEAMYSTHVSGRRLNWIESHRAALREQGSDDVSWTEGSRAAALTTRSVSIHTEEHLIAASPMCDNLGDERLLGHAVFSYIISTY
jgi:hypothetical protein